MESKRRFRGTEGRISLEYSWFRGRIKEKIPSRDKVVQMEVTDEKREKLLFPTRTEEQVREPWRNLPVSFAAILVFLKNRDCLIFPSCTLNAGTKDGVIEAV